MWKAFTELGTTMQRRLSRSRELQWDVGEGLLRPRMSTQLSIEPRRGHRIGEHVQTNTSDAVVPRKPVIAIFMNQMVQTMGVACREGKDATKLVKAS